MKHMQLWAVVVVAALVVSGYLLLPQNMGGGGALEATTVAPTFSNANYGVLGITKIAFQNDSDRWLIQITQRDIGHILTGTTYAAKLTPDTNGDKKQEISGSTGELVTSDGQSTKTATIFLQPQSEACTYAIRSDPNQDKLVRYKVKYYPTYAFQSISTSNDVSYSYILSGNLFSIGLAKPYTDNIDKIANDCYSLGLSRNTKDYYMGLTRACDSNGLNCGAWYTPFCIYPAELGRIGRADASVIFKTAIGISIGNSAPVSGTLTNSVYCPPNDPNCGQAVNIGNYGKAFWLWNGGSGRYCPGLQDQQAVPGYIPLSEGGTSYLQAAPALPENGYSETPPTDALNNNLANSLQLESTNVNIIDVLSGWHLYNNRLQNLKMGGLSQQAQKTEVEKDIGCISNCAYIGGPSINLAPMVLKGSNGQMFMFEGNGGLSGIIQQDIQPTHIQVYNGNPTATVKVTPTSTIGTPLSSGTINGVITMTVAPGTFIYPNFLVEINEATLPITKWTIIPQECKPQIQAIDTNPIIGGTMSTPVKVKVTNGAGGSPTCSMTASVLCQTGYSSTVPAQLGVFATGQSKTVTLDFSCQVAQQQSDNCIIKVTGARGESASLKLNTICKPNYDCTPNTLFCADGNHRVQCTADGKYGTAEYCDVCVPTSSGADCRRTITEICNNSIDDNNNGLIDCQDPDCKDSPKCAIPPNTWNDEIFAGLVATLVAILVFSLVYSYRKKPKNKMAISLVAAGIVGVLVFAGVWSLHLQVSDPFAGFIPKGPTCSTAGLWLGPVDPGYLGCVGGEIGYYLGYAIALGAGALAAFLLWGALSKNPAFRGKPAMVITLPLISFFIVFMIAKALAPLAIALLVIFLIIRYILPGVGGAVALVR